MVHGQIKDQAETLLTTICMVIPYKVQAYYLPDPGGMLASSRGYEHVVAWHVDHTPLFTTEDAKVVMFQSLVWDMPQNNTTLSLYLTNGTEHAARIVRRKGKRSERRMVGHPNELPNWQWSYNGRMSPAAAHHIINNALEIGGQDAQAEPTE